MNINITEEKKTRYSIFLACLDTIGKNMFVVKEEKFTCDDGSDSDCTSIVRLVSCENGNMGTLIMVENHKVKDRHDSRGAEIIDVTNLSQESVRKVWDYCLEVCDWDKKTPKEGIEVFKARKGGEVQIDRFKSLPKALK